MDALAGYNKEICTALGALLVLYFVVSRIFNDPLKAFPGPKIAAWSGWYVAYYETMKGGLLLEKVQELHKQYGPVVRIGPKLLHFSDTRAYPDIYNSNPSIVKYPAFYTKFNDRPALFSFIEWPDHKARHELISPLFSRRAILSLEKFVQEKVDLLVEQMSSYDTQSINMALALRSATVDIITSYCFATTWSTLTFPSFEHPLLLSMQAGVNFACFLINFPIMGALVKRLPEWAVMIMSPATKGILDFKKSMSGQIDSLLANPGSLADAEHETIFHHLMDPEYTKKRGKVLNRIDLLEEGMNLMFAGSDTVGNACTVGIFHVLNNDDIRVRLRRELDQAWPDVDVVMGYESLKKLPYLTGVIKEALRLSHGVVSYMPRLVRAPVQVMGLDIPAGTCISMTPTFMHWSEEVFPDPHRFDPGRWLQDDTKELESHLVPFSRGLRSCTGMNLAWCELYLLFANVIRKLDLEIDGTTVEDLEFRAFFTAEYRRRAFHARVRGRIGDVAA